MSDIRYIQSNLVNVNDAAGKFLVTLFWGDKVTVTGNSGNKTEIELWLKVPVAGGKSVWQLGKGYLPAKAKLSEQTDVLKVRFVDVGQGDGAIIETPKGEIVIIDGGKGDPMVRYTSVLYELSRRSKPLPVGAVVVTHGDGDHIEGLLKILDKQVNGKPAIAPQRVFHNGLFKVSGKPKDKDAFGATVLNVGKLYCSELVDDLTTIASARLSENFQKWQQSLINLRTAGALGEVRRIAYGDDAVFDFLKAEGVTVKVLGPIVDTLQGKPTLRLLNKPGSRNSPSDSHTINGHSVALRLTYGNVRFLLGADLNEESEERLLEKSKTDDISLESEILKVPHHGSHEFNPNMLSAIRPVVSIVSSGDENAMEEYIHPRATLMGALGKYSRQSVAKPLVYVTEMVAFFKKEANLCRKGETEPVDNAYIKSQYGIVHIRTDGKRVLVVTHSGKASMKEHYVFSVDDHGEISFEE